MRPGRWFVLIFAAGVAGYVVAAWMFGTEPVTRALLATSVVAALVSLVVGERLQGGRLSAATCIVRGNGCWHVRVGGGLA